MKLNEKQEDLLPTKIDDDGYEYVTLIKTDGTVVNRRVNELVAEAFVPNPDHKKYIRHKDGNKLNIRADNLEWVDRLD